MKHIPHGIIVKLLISKGYHILFHFCWCKQWKSTIEVLPLPPWMVPISDLAHGLLSAGFDSVDHQVLIERLQRTYCSQSFALLPDSYFSCQAAQVSPRSCTSIPVAVLSATVCPLRSVSTAFCRSSSAVCSENLHNRHGFSWILLCCSGIMEWLTTSAPWPQSDTYWF